MTFSEVVRWLTSGSAILFAVPASILCYIPMAHQLRRSTRSLALHCAILLVLAGLGTSILLWRFPYLDETVVLTPFLGLFFAYYATSTRAQVFQSTGIFLAVCGYYAIISFGAFLIDTAVRINGGAGFSQGLLYAVQLGMMIVFSVPVALFLQRQGIYLVDHLRDGPVWLMMGAVSIMTFVILSVMAPRLEDMSQMPRFRTGFLVVALMVSLMYMVTCAFFFLSGVSLIRKEELQEQETVFRMQRKQYIQLEDQIEQIRILRHDFRHALRFLQKLAEEGDIDEIRKYLARYEDSIPTQTLTSYCDNDLINAILNYYADQARARNTKTEFLVDVPQLPQEQTFDLISLLSNLLENAQQGCDTVSVEDRSIRLRMSVVNDENLYIIITNSFDGIVRRAGSRYLSTRRKQGGRGVGLHSIEQTVARYGGEVSFYHKGRIFNVDLTMKIRRAPEV
ncbi:MAG: sensor histidine kinase [Firmicutes bacterium]|nr:sensor histidine kinase [Bacillota bacterium]